MYIPPSFYDHIRNTIRVSDIVRIKVKLTKKGAEYSGLCPFHNEKTPSFTVNDQKRFYHCFGCAEHGDAIQFIAATTGLSYKESAIKIANDHNIELPKISSNDQKKYDKIEQIQDVSKLAADFFMQNLSAQQTDYLKSRNITDQTIKEFEIGFAPRTAIANADISNDLEKFFSNKSIHSSKLFEAGLLNKNQQGKAYQTFTNRIIFPIKNNYNKVIGFGGRALGNNLPKYLNSQETILFKKNQVLYGENIALSHAHRNNYYILVEGYMDVLCLHQAGFKETVASLGTAVNLTHIQKLWNSADEIILALDGDAAGIKATLKLINIILPHIKYNKLVSFIKMPPNLDPDDMINQYGVEAFRKLLQKRHGLSQSIWEYEYNNQDFSTAESVAILEKKLQLYTEAIEDPVLKSNFARYFKNMIWNNILRRNNTQKKAHIQINHDIINQKSVSKLETLEHLLCAFLLKKPNVIKDLTIFAAISNLEFSNNLLNDFKNWLIDLIIDYPKQDKIDHNEIQQYIANNVKSTGFSNSYVLLSGNDVLCNDFNFSVINESIDEKLEFDFLYKNYYMLILSNEYLAFSSSPNRTSDKVKFYLKEIKTLSEEIEKLRKQISD